MYESKVGRRICLRCGLLQFLIALAGCAPSVPLAPPPPQIRVIRASVTSGSLDQADLALELDCSNSSDMSVSFSQIHYSLSSADRVFATGRAPWRTTVPARAKQVVTVPLGVSYDTLFESGSGVTRGSVVPFQARLELLAPTEGGGTMIVPAEGRGELPVPAPPAVRLEELQWLHIDEGRAEARLRIKVTNTEQFRVKLARLSSQVWLEGRAVTSTDLDKLAGTELPPGAEQSLETTISFVPAEARLPVNQLSRGRPGSYRLEGVCRVTTSFGPLDLAFDHSGTAPFRAE